jgi:hypothetical protein
MPFTFRKHPHLGPIRFNFTEHGLSSITIRVGRWSWNSRTGRHSVDLPGPVNWRSRGRRNR